MAIFAFKPIAEEFHSNVKEEVLEGPAVDLVHLSRQSLGDRALEEEILGLFRCQSKLYLQRLNTAGTASERKMAAHTILGSARGIGAWRVAQAAEAIKLTGGAMPDTKQLTLCIDDANRYIEDLLN